MEIKKFEEMGQPEKWKVTVKGEAVAHIGNGNRYRKLVGENLQELDGEDCQDKFSEYFDRDESFYDDVDGGYLHFKYDGDHEEPKLWSVTTYSSTRELTEDELHDLGEYTQGQWSDGIGEGFEQYECTFMNLDGDDEPVFISPWKGGQVLTVTQERIQ